MTYFSIPLIITHIYFKTVKKNSTIMPMDVISFINDKKDNMRHACGLINSFVQGLINGEIPDYQAAAWLMAVNFNGLDPDETVALTEAIVHSGKVASYKGLPGPVVDKHSTGGVGDKVTLVLLPILAEMGMFIPKHSGRALGFTGGTIDKLESIPGFNPFLPEDRYIQVVRDVGFAIGGQSADMCPADGILYALRDATATVNETGLIAASVMSKKIAGGAKYILIDVKVGRGAFMPDEESARRLAERMVYIGDALGRDVRCILTRMNQPLGRAVGNSLEVNEALECLRGKGSPDVMELCRAASIELAVMAGLYDSSAAADRFDNAVNKGTALDRFTRFVKAQGGDTAWISSGKGLPVAENIIEVKYEGSNGYVIGLDALAIGECVRRMGGGRLSKADKIDPAVGIVIRKKIGDAVNGGDVLATIYCGASGDSGQWAEKVRAAFSFGDKVGDADILIGRIP